jgi:hypothetical protein
MMTAAESRSSPRQLVGYAVKAALFSPFVGAGFLKCLVYVGLLDKALSRTSVLVAVLACWLLFFVADVLSGHLVRPVGLFFTTLYDPDASVADKLKAPFKSWLGRAMLILLLPWLGNFINGTF